MTCSKAYPYACHFHCIDTVGVAEDEQMDQLKRRLEDTERAMERLMSQMGSVSDKLTAAKITEVLSQAQAQAKLLKVSKLGVSLTLLLSLCLSTRGCFGLPLHLLSVFLSLHQYLTPCLSLCRWC